MWIALKRIIRSGFVNFWRNKYITIASIFVLTITLFVIGGLVLGASYLDDALTGIKERVDISVTFKLDASENEVLGLKESLELLPEVQSVTYSSRDEELAGFRERHKDNALLIQSLEEVGNPFGARIAILAKDPSQYETVSNFLDNYDQNTGQAIIDRISFKRDIVERLTALIDTTQKVGLTVSILLIVMSIMVTFNTISLTIYTVRDEISVMRLVGASNAYVRGPFMVEGILAGIIASFVSIVLLYPLAVWVRNSTLSVYGGVDLVSYYMTDFGKIFLIILASGVVLGLVSSFLATRKYLKI